jgi:hypothetical protein
MTWGGQAGSANVGKLGTNARAAMSGDLFTLAQADMHGF